MRFLFVAVAGLLASCAAAPADPEPADLDKDLLKRPETLYRFWASALQNRNFDRAHACLSAAAKRRLTVEEFAVAMTSFDEIRRRREGAQVQALALDPDGDAATLRVCNPEFALTHEYRIVHEFK